MLAEVERGQAVYAGNCAGCHRDRGEGQPHWEDILAGKVLRKIKVGGQPTRLVVVRANPSAEAGDGKQLRP